MKTTQELNNLKSQDIYSLILFALYKLREIPEYSTLSELAYIVDKENLLKLCEYFGGLTIKIPTIEDLEFTMYALSVYQHVNIEGMQLDEALRGSGCKHEDLTRVRSDYIKLCDILKKYNFTHRDFYGEENNV